MSGMGGRKMSINNASYGNFKIDFWMKHLFSRYFEDIDKISNTQTSSVFLGILGPCSILIIF